MVKDTFFEHLGEVNSLANFENSHKLVLIKYILECSNESGFALREDVTRNFRDFYRIRKRKGLIPDVNSDSCITEVNLSSLTDIYHFIMQHPFRALNESGFIKIVRKKVDSKVYFFFNRELWKSLSEQDMQNIHSSVDLKINSYFKEIDEYAESILLHNEDKVTGKPKRTISPFQKLKKKMEREFKAKKFIGDIILSDNEEEILFDYFKVKCHVLINSGSHRLIDPIFTVALVRIGMKRYDGSFWPHVKNILGVDRLPSNQQTWIGAVATDTLKAHEKIIVGEHERISNILVHGFVSDHYSADFFNFLFAFYRLDLERDLQRFDKEAMNALVETMVRNDNTGRSYWLVQQTANAVRANTRGSKTRIRRLLKLIDRCFWEGDVYLNTNHRITRLLNLWKINSKEFIGEYDRVNSGGNLNGRKRNYFTPYIKCDLSSTQFQLVLPSQLINEEISENVLWSITVGEENNTFDSMLFQAVTGYKTEEVVVNIRSVELFSDFTISLISNGNKIRQFRVKNEEIRFFDKEGYFVRTDSVSKGEMYSFSALDFTPISDAVVESIKINGMIRTYYDFEHGDVIRLPDGQPLSVGKSLEEGLLQRGRVNGAYVFEGNEKIPIYKRLPLLLMKIKKSKSNGTLIKINQKRFRLFDEQTQEIRTEAIELNNRSGEVGYLINLMDYGFENEGIYEIVVDVPNDKASRTWRFIYIRDLEYTFEDSPYIFKEKGTISFDNNTVMVPMDTHGTKKIHGENKYNFIINAENSEVRFNYNINERNIPIIFEIPVLTWKFSEGIWNTEKPSEIWRGDFPTYMYFKYPSNTLSLSMEDQSDEIDEDHTKIYKKKSTTNQFECDVTSFISWFGREVETRTISLDVFGKHIPFLEVVTKSKAVLSYISGDFQRNLFSCRFDIIGNLNYYIDIKCGDKLIAEKIQVIHGEVEYETELVSGDYTVSLFEEDEDDTGFGDFNYLPLGEVTLELINPQDLEGKCIILKHIKKSENSPFKSRLECTYRISDLQLIGQNDTHLYHGKMVAEDRFGYFIKEISVVNVEFYDLKKLKFANITFKDEYGDETDFLYDYENFRVVKEEDPRLSAAEKYRRYDVVYSGEYVYEIEFQKNNFIRKDK